MVEPTRRRPTGDGGLTLIELLVTMVILAGAMAIVTSAIIGVQRYVGDVQGSSDANSEARRAVAQIDRQVRSGNVLYSPANEIEPGSPRLTRDLRVRKTLLIRADGGVHTQRRFRRAAGVRSHQRHARLGRADRSVPLRRAVFEIRSALCEFETSHRH